MPTHTSSNPTLPHVLPLTVSPRLRKGGGFGKTRQDAGFPDNIMACLSGPSDLILFEAESSRLLVCRGAEVDFYDNGHSGEKYVVSGAAFF